MKTKIISMGALFFLLSFGIAGAQLVPAPPPAQVLLPGKSIPQWVTPLPVAGQISVVDATGGPTPAPPILYTIDMKEFKANILPPATPTTPAYTGSWVWGYLTAGDTTTNPRESYLGPVVVAKKGVETRPTYTNLLPYGGLSNVQPLLPIDPTIDWANPLGTVCTPDAAGVLPVACSTFAYRGPQPTAPHLHGGEVEPLYDGGPEAWWLPAGAAATNVTGIGSPAVPGAGSAQFIYPTGQQAGSIWFHDHAMGITRLNVFAGLAGLYLITDPAKELPNANDTVACTAPGAICLPAFPQYDIPLIIQDRSFDTTGQIFYNLASNPQPNPLVHPFWIPEFIGDAIVVNGKTWPYLDVEPRQYRFRLVNGSNARTYNLSLDNKAPFLAIATDDGYLDTAVSTPSLLIAPGERYEVIIDFTAVKPGSKILMINNARTPYPGGVSVNNSTTGSIIQFRVVKALTTAIPNTTIAVGTNLRPNNPILNIKGVTPMFKRQLTLNEILSPTGPLELVLNNTTYSGVVAGMTTRESEKPQIGATELWEIINTTADAHPIHIHLASFQIVNRQAYDNGPKKGYVAAYSAALLAAGVGAGAGPPNAYMTPNADGAIGGNPAISLFLGKNPVKPPLPYENGWKDTAIMMPGEVTRIMIRWAPTDTPVGSETLGTSQYPFDPTQLAGTVGYVWHCHIIDHEDNDMMRPYVVMSTKQ